jgi:hypothetical protein
MINKFYKKGSFLEVKDEGRYLILSNDPHVLQPLLCPKCETQTANQASFVAVCCLIVISCVVVLCIAPR